MKYFLLIAGQGYYPESGTDDWIKTYETKEEILKIITVDQFTRGKYTIYNCEYDWYEIVDLRNWIN